MIEERVVFERGRLVFHSPSTRIHVGDGIRRGKPEISVEGGVHRGVVSIGIFIHWRKNLIFLPESALTFVLKEQIVGLLVADQIIDSPLVQHFSLGEIALLVL